MKILLFLLLLLAPAMLRAQISPNPAPADSRYRQDPDDSRWDNSFGSGNGLTGPWYSGLSSLLRSQGSLFAAGRFTQAGDVAAHNIARYDGARWHALAGGGEAGVNGFVMALAAIGSDVYAGGFFDSAGGFPTGAVARWDGGSWSPVGDELHGQVSALAVIDGKLYAGGSFNIGRSSTLHRIARLDGDNWQPVGDRIDGTIWAIASGKDALYIGGDFTSAGGLATGPVARWSAAAGNWMPLGPELRDTFSGRAEVRSIVVDGDDLYVGGRFDRAGDMPAGNIARWDGTTWQELGEGISSEEGYPPLVLSIAVTATDIYAGGTFGKIGGRGPGYIARWDRAAGQWRNLGSGVEICEGFECMTSVGALLPEGSDLYVGGNFNIAGGKPSLMIGRWMAGPAGVENRESNLSVALTLSPTPFSGTTSLSFALPARAFVQLGISDVQGKRIAMLIDETLPAGEHRVAWNGSHLPAGIYLCRLIVDGRSSTGTIVKLP